MAVLVLMGLLWSQAVPTARLSPSVTGHRELGMLVAEEAPVVDVADVVVGVAAAAAVVAVEEAQAYGGGAGPGEDFVSLGAVGPDNRSEAPEEFCWMGPSRAWEADTSSA